MGNYEEEVLRLLSEIRELLTPIAAHFQPEYIDTKQKQLEEILSTELKQRIYFLLFDPRRLPQTEIAKEVNTTQPSVSRLIASLLEAGLIEKGLNENGKDYYIDKFRLAKKLELKNGKLSE